MEKPIRFMMHLNQIIKIFLFTSVLLIGCGAPMQYDMAPDNGLDTIADSSASVGSASSEQADTIVKPIAIEQITIEPSPISEPMISEQNQVSPDTFFYKQVQHNDADSNFAHKKKYYKNQNIKVKALNDTIKSIDEKFNKIEQKINSMKKGG